MAVSIPKKEEKVYGAAHLILKRVAGLEKRLMEDKHLCRVDSKSPKITEIGLVRITQLNPAYRARAAEWNLCSSRTDALSMGFLEWLERGC